MSVTTTTTMNNVDSSGTVPDTSLFVTLTATSNPGKVFTSLTISTSVDMHTPSMTEIHSTAIQLTASKVSSVFSATSIINSQDGTLPSIKTSSDIFIIIAVVTLVVVIAGITVGIIVIALVSRNKRSKKSITSKNEPIYHYISDASVGTVDISLQEVKDHTRNRKQECEQHIYAAVDELHNSNGQNILINPVYDINENNTSIGLHEAIPTTKGETHMHSLLQVSTKNVKESKEKNFNTQAIKNDISEMYAVVDKKKFQNGAKIDDEYAVVDKMAKKYKKSNGMFP